MTEQRGGGLKRELSIVDVAANVINITVGSGIFLLPALIAGILGNASIVAYVLCGFMFILVVLCYAEASSRIDSSGGAYAYIEKAFGPYFGFVANILFAASGVLLCAALVNGIADMLSVPFPVFDLLFSRAILYLIGFGLIAYSNILGVKQGMKVVKTTTILKMVPLVVLILVGIFSLNTDNLQWEGFPAGEKLGEASLLLFFAFIGGETSLNVSGEMKNPRRTAPLGLLLGVGLVVVFYSLIQITAQSTLGPDLINQKAPLVAVAGKLAGNFGTKVLLAAGLISIIGSLYSCVFVFSRVFYAGAKDGLLPKPLARVHLKYATPYWSIITLLVLSFILAISGGFKQLIILVSISMLLLYLGVALAVIKFRWRGSKKYPASFLLPGGIFVPILTLGIVVWFLSHSKMGEIISAAIFISIVSIIYGIKVWILKRKGGISVPGVD